MAPASNTVPTSSKGTPMARSSKVSLLKSPPVSTNPNSSPTSATPPIPPLPWKNCWFPVAVSLAAEPYSDVDRTGLGGATEPF